MPPTPLHMVLARQLALDLGIGELAEHQGAYLLGATTPDIRVITRQDRMSTHFFDLGVFEHQDSVQGFLKEHGRFAQPENLNPETRSWVAGYITHLVMDEQYITGVYRRFFAKHDDLGGKIRANVMDRLLQFDLDRAYRQDPEVTRAICEALGDTITGIDAGFIDAETLDQWRKVMFDIMSRGMDWDRIRGMIANHLRYAGLEEGETLTSFLDSLPELLDETIAHVTSAEVEGFVKRSTAAAAEAVERYLGCG